MDWALAQGNEVGPEGRTEQKGGQESGNSGSCVVGIPETCCDRKKVLREMPWRVPLSAVLVSLEGRKRYKVNLTFAMGGKCHLDGPG